MDSSFLHLRLPSSAYTSGSSPTAVPKVAVDPLVVASVLDHYTRRQDSKSGVVGALLGARLEDGTESIEVRNAFPLAYQEAVDGRPQLDMEHFTTMLHLHTRVNAKEVLVGWYSTSEPDEKAAAIHQEVFSKMGGEVLCVIDLEAMQLGKSMPIKAYVAAPAGVPSSPDGTLYTQCPLTILSSPLSSSTLSLFSRPENPTPLESDIQALERSINRLSELLRIVGKYVTDVSEGKQAGNRKLGRYLVDVIESVPKFETEEFNRMFSKHLQDMLMVTYLTDLTKAQLAIAEKLIVSA